MKNGTVDTLLLVFADVGSRWGPGANTVDCKKVSGVVPEQVLFDVFLYF